MPITITYLNWGDYCTLWIITERRDGLTYKTKQVGYVKPDYAPKDDELLTPLSTSLIGKEITLCR